jgi:hypothetical protein
LLGQRQSKKENVAPQFHLIVKHSLQAIFVFVAACVVNVARPRTDAVSNQW